MKERPILFSGEMVKAILAGRKTQTRRVAKRLFDARFHDIQEEDGLWTIYGDWPTNYDGEVQMNEFSESFKCPYGQPGDRLYVKETFTSTPDRQTILFRADPFYQDMPKGDLGRDWGWTPSIHMPRWASRINLEITSVRVERVQDISEEDAMAEGVDRGDWSCPGLSMCGGPSSECLNCLSPIKDYAALWDSLNAGRGFSWDVNPWAWAIEFKRVA